MKNYSESRALLCNFSRDTLSGFYKSCEDFFVFLLQFHRGIKSTWKPEPDLWPQLIFVLRLNFLGEIKLLPPSGYTST